MILRRAGAHQFVIARSNPCSVSNTVATKRVSLFSERQIELGCFVTGVEDEPRRLAATKSGRSFLDESIDMTAFNGEITPTDIL
ncbi:MAG: hypothetical protein JWR73_795, partial [Tardiphaga sp.]|nr:hypothetical protein [Tardiphaga sp.]